MFPPQTLVLVLHYTRMVIGRDPRKEQRLSVRHVGWLPKLWNRYCVYIKLTAFMRLINLVQYAVDRGCANCLTLRT